MLAQSIFDSSTVNPKRITNNGVTLSSLIKVFGSSGFFAGESPNSKLDISTSSDFNIGTNDFTVDFWFNLATVTGQQVIFCIAQDANNFFVVRYASSTGIFEVAQVTSGSEVASFRYTSPLTIGTWYHFAVVRSVGNLMVFINGVSQTLFGSSGSFSGLNIGYSTGGVEIGDYPTFITDTPIVGYLDEFRVSGVARWTSNFTPLTSEYTSDSSTILLLHFDYPPPILNAPQMGISSAYLSWPAVSGATDYTLEYGTSSGDYTQEVTTGNVLGYSINGLNSSQEYFFVLTATDGVNTTLNSNEVNGTTITVSIPSIGAITGLISFYNQYGNEEFFVAQAGADIWNNGPEGTWRTITGNVVKITNAQNNLASMAVLNNILYGVDRLEDQFWEWGLTGNAIPVPAGALYSVSVNNGGRGYSLGDILTVQGGTGGQVQVTEVTTGTNGAISETTLENNGSGYSVGDILAISGGTNGTIQVTGIDSNGGITSYVVSNSGQTYSIVTGATLTGGSGSGATININLVFISGTIEAVLIYDPTGRSTSGSSYQASTNAPVSGGTGTGASLVINATTPQINGNFVVNFNNSIFVNAGSELPTALYYSDLNLGYAINPVNFLLFNTGQGSSLTGAVNALFGNMFVFKNKSVHVVSPTGSIPAYSNFLYCDGIGCVSHQSIVTLPGGTIMFWDTDDIYMIVGNEVLSATNHPKTKNPRLRNFFRNNVNSNRLKFVCGVYYAPLDCVFWFYSSPSSNSNDMCLAYHVKTKSFWPLTLRGACCAIRIIQNVSNLYTGDIDGYIYEQDNGGSFNGNPIPWNVQIPWQALGDLLSRKKGDLVYTILEQQSNFDVYCDVFLNQSNVAYSTNNILQTLGITTTGAQFSNGADNNVFDTAVFASDSTGIMESSFLIDTLFKTISLNFHGSNLNQPLTIHRIALTSRELEMSRLTD